MDLSDTDLGSIPPAEQLRLSAALDTLPPLRRAILFAAAQPGTAASDIADQLGFQVHQVRDEIRQGLAQLGLRREPAAEPS